MRVKEKRGRFAAERRGRQPSPEEAPLPNIDAESLQWRKRTNDDAFEGRWLIRAPCRDDYLVRRHETDSRRRLGRRPSRLRRRCPESSRRDVSALLRRGRTRRRRSLRLRVLRPPFVVGATRGRHGGVRFEASRELPVGLLPARAEALHDVSRRELLRRVDARRRFDVRRSERQPGIRQTVRVGARDLRRHLPPQVRRLVRLPGRR